MDAFAHMLGCLWYKDDLDVKAGRPRRDLGRPPPNEFRVALTELLNPDLRKELRKFLEQAKDEQGRPVRELGYVDKDKFLEHYRQSGVPFKVVG